MSFACLPNDRSVDLDRHAHPVEEIGWSMTPKDVCVGGSNGEDVAISNVKCARQGLSPHGFWVVT